MDAVIVNFRRGKDTQKDSHMIVQVEGVDSKEKAEKLLGKKAVWKSPAGKEIKGVLKAAHGNNGAIRVIFEKGMPGQAIASKIKIE